MSDIRTFRKSVSLLKKRGLLPEKTSRGNKLDARSAQPNWKAPNGQKLSTLVKKYDDVVSGKVTPVKVSPQKARQFRKAGYDVVSDRVLIPHSSNERAVIEKGEVVIKSTTGIERIQIPVEFENLDQYLNDIARDTARIDRMKRDNEYFGFRFFGNNSSALYSSIDLAIEDLSKYETVLEHGDESGKKLLKKSSFKAQEVYKILEIVRVGRKAPWMFPSERRHLMSKDYNRKRMKRFRERMKRKPKHIQEHYRELARGRYKAYRQRIKKDPKRNKAYKQAAKKRASKAHKARAAERKRKSTNAKKNRRNRS